MIERTNEKKYLKCAAYKCSKTLTKCLLVIIQVNSILKSYQHPSYTTVVNNLCLTDKVVNYFEGFITADETHTITLKDFGLI